MGNIQNVSLKRDEEIKDLEWIADDMGIDKSPPVVIRALIRMHKRSKPPVHISNPVDGDG